AEPEPQAWVEHKPAGAVVHTRRMPDDAAAALEQRVLDAVAGRQGVRVLHGKRVVELSVLEATKGTALDALRHELDAAGVLYAGDDVTDEDAFAVLGPDDVGVKVGDGETRAAHRVPDPAALGLALDRLADPVLGRRRHSHQPCDVPSSGCRDPADGSHRGRRRRPWRVISRLPGGRTTSAVTASV